MESQRHRTGSPSGFDSIRAPISLEPVQSGVRAAERMVSVTTRKVVAGDPETVWQRLLFYEELAKPPSWILRALLPIPVRTEGEKSRIGGAVTCHYAKGHLVKRVTMVERARRLAFEISEQRLRIRGGIHLDGGSYGLRCLRDGRTEITLETRYRSPNFPHWFWGRVEALLCHEFHRSILNAMGSANGRRVRPGLQ
jgi:hypothetical protein